MKTTALLLIILCWITIGGSCRIQAAQGADTTAKQVESEPEPDPRFKGIPTKYHDYLKIVAKKDPRFISTWQNAMALWDEANRCATVFGLRERKRARNQLQKVMIQLKNEQSKLWKAYERFQKPIADEEAKLKVTAFKLSEKKDALTNPEINKRIRELSDQAYILGEQLNALKALIDKATPPAYTMPSDLIHIGITVHDQTAMKFARENPNLIEARLIVMDCQADIATLEQVKAKIEADPKQRWGYAEENEMNKASQNLDKAVEQLERERDKAKTPLLRDAEKLQERIDWATEKIEDAEERNRNATTYRERLVEYEAERNTCNEILAVIDKIATWKKPDKE